MNMLQSMQRLSESPWNQETWGDSVWAAASPTKAPTTAPTTGMVPGANSQIGKAPTTYGEPSSGSGVSWTNLGGYQIPVYDQSVFKPWKRDIMGTVDAGDGSNYGVIGQEDVWGLDHNDAYSLYGENSPYNYWANWSLTGTGKGIGDSGGFGYQLDPNGFDGLLKVGDKEGMRVRYSLQDGKYVPTLVGKEGWNSNRDNTGDFTALAMVLGGAAAGMAGPAGTAASGAGTTGGTVGSTVGQGTLSQLMSGGLGSSGTGFGIGTAGQGALGSGLLPTGAAGTLGGSFGGLSQLGAYTGAVGGSLGGLAGSGGAGIGSSLWDVAKQGYDLYSKGKRVYNTFNQLTQDPQVRTSGSGSGGGSGFMGDLLKFGGGIYSDHQNRKAFEGLNDYFSRMEMQRAPYQEKLTESYTNPNSYLQSPEYQALAAIRGNQLNRGAARAGRLANDVDREVLMQQHAQKALGDYRSGLTNAINANRLPDQILRDAMTRKGNAGGPTMGGIGAGGGGSFIDNILKYGKQGYDMFFGDQGGLDFSGVWDADKLDLGNNGFLDAWNWDDSSSWDMTDWFDEGDGFDIGGIFGGW